MITDELTERFDIQQTGTQNNQLSHMLAQITDGAARAVVRNEDTENGFEIWRRLRRQFALPEREREPRIC